MSEKWEDQDDTADEIISILKISEKFICTFTKKTSCSNLNIYEIEDNILVKIYQVKLDNVISRYSNIITTSKRHLIYTDDRGDLLQFKWKNSQAMLIKKIKRLNLSKIISMDKNIIVSMNL
jgi:hypothetical protein